MKLDAIEAAIKAVLRRTRAKFNRGPTKRCERCKTPFGEGEPWWGPSAGRWYCQGCYWAAECQ